MRTAVFKEVLYTDALPQVDIIFFLRRSNATLSVSIREINPQVLHFLQFTP